MKNFAVLKYQQFTLASPLSNTKPGYYQSRPRGSAHTAWTGEKNIRPPCHNWKKYPLFKDYFRSLCTGVPPVLVQKPGNNGGKAYEGLPVAQKNMS